MMSNADAPSTIKPLDEKIVEPDCRFNREGLFEGDRVTAYQTSTVPVGSTCAAETRTCRGGQLSGSYQFSTCLPGVPASCLQNGTTIPHNRSLKFFKTSSVAFGGTCESEDRTCTNGVLSGSFIHSECINEYPTDCKIGTVRWAHGRQKLFFKNLTAPFGESCLSEYRECHNGEVINGSYEQPGCSYDLPKNCVHGGQTIMHDMSLDFYQADSVPFGQTCQKKTLRCFNGTVTGDLSFASKDCFTQSAGDCTLYDGTPVRHTGSIIAYQYQNIAFGDSCEKYAKTLRCDNKVLSPEPTVYKYSECRASVTKDCLLPDGGKIEHGNSETLKKLKYLLEGEVCESSWNIESVTCNNGVLSGTARYRSCEATLAPQNLTPAGGNGGLPFENRCQTPGARGIGLLGGAGANMDRIGLRCSTAPDTGTSGGSSGTPFSVLCPTGKYLTGISGTTSTNYFRGTGYVQSIRPYCANLDGSNGEYLHTLGTPNTYTFYQICAPGSVVIGIKGRSGTLVDQIQIMCGKVVEAANINCAGQWYNQGCALMYRGTPYGNEARRFFQTQPVGGSGTACTIQDGQFEEVEDGCGTIDDVGGGIQR